MKVPKSRSTILKMFLALKKEIGHIVVTSNPSCDYEVITRSKMLRFFLVSKLNVSFLGDELNFSHFRIWFGNIGRMILLLLLAECAQTLQIPSELLIG